MSNQINGMVQANRNTQDANNLIQTAESGLSDISGILSRMRELAVQASTDTLNDVDRASINFEFQTLKNELTRIANATEYNKMNVLNGTYQTGTSEVGSYAPNSQSHIDRVAQDNPNDFNLSERGFWQLQVGADNDANNQIELSIINATAEGLGLTKYDYQPQQVQKVVDDNPIYYDPEGKETIAPQHQKEHKKQHQKQHQNNKKKIKKNIRNNIKNNIRNNIRFRNNIKTKTT